MERLPHHPRNLRELIEADLRRAARLIIKVQDEIDWYQPKHSRTATPSTTRTTRCRFNSVRICEGCAAR